MRLDPAAAVRSLLRRPGFTAVAVTTITLAIAANTAVFSLVNGVLLRPFPFRDPARQMTIDSKAATGFHVSTSVPNFRDWRDRNRSFDAFAGMASWSHTLTGRGPARSVNSAIVIGDLFGTLGISAVRGRVLTAEEAASHYTGANVAVIGHAFWVDQLGADPGAVGQTLVLDQTPYTIVGVLGQNIGFPDVDVPVYVPMASLRDLPWDDRDSGFGMRVIARLAPGVSLNVAKLDLTRVGREVVDQFGGTAAVPEVRSLESFYLRTVRTQLWILLGAVGMVLLIAVANVGNLLLARGEDRQKELAVRAALGADRASLLGLLVAESLVIALTGGALGIALAYVGLGALIPLLPADIPLVLQSQVRVDGRILAASIATALAAGLVFGLAPAIRATRAGIAGAFRVASRSVTAGGGRLRAGLVVTEVALALVLVVSAGLLLRSLDRLTNVDKGFRTEGLVTAAVTIPGQRSATKASWLAFYSELRTRATTLPGVSEAAIALLLPLSGRNWEFRVWPEGTPPEVKTGQSVLFNIVSPEYFSTMRVPVLRGRGFEMSDRDGSQPVVIVDETMAERFWPGQDPIGQRITINERDSTGGTMYRTVVGVTKNVRHYQLVEPSRIQMYIPLAQTGQRFGMPLRLIVVGDGRAETIAEPLRALVGELDRDAPVSELAPLERNVDQSIAERRAMTRVLTIFGGAALALAALGIFGVMSYLVARRTREIGVRIALGAGAAQVTRWIGGRALRLTIAGIGIGTVASVALTRLLRSVLFEVSPLDPIIFAIGCLGLGGVAILAALIPARRAIRVDPITVLNDEG